MQSRLPIIERAYILARSGSCKHPSDVRSKLKAEGYFQVDDFINGRKFLADLKDICIAATNVETGAAPVKR